MDNLKNNRALVKRILEENPITRNSDSLLELEVLKALAKGRGTDLKLISVETFMKNRNNWKFPKSETIRRNRQLIQAKYPELAASDPIDAHRLANEERVRDYVRNAKYEA